MSGLTALLVGVHPTGLYRWEAACGLEDVREAVTAAGWRFRMLDGAQVGSKPEFLAAVGRVLEFPSTYGVNLDALADLLDDLPAATVLLWEGWAPFAYADPAAFSTAVQVLRERCEDPRGAPFAVLLRGYGPELPGVGLLD